MIPCEICKKEYNRITKGHVNLHGIKSIQEYMILYPGRPIFSDELKKKISDETKIGMSKCRDKFLDSIKKRESNPKYRLKRTLHNRKIHSDGCLKKSYLSESRNSKISVASIKMRKDRREEYVEIGKEIQRKQLKKLGRVEYNNRLKRIAPLGYKTILRTHGFNKFEKRLYKQLDDESIQYIPQFELENKQYDAYLPDFNILLEFDGVFYHKESINECQYDFQINNFKNDIVKNNIAFRNNIPLLRIREHNEPVSIKNILENVE